MSEEHRLTLVGDGETVELLTALQQQYGDLDATITERPDGSAALVLDMDRIVQRTAGEPSDYTIDTWTASDGSTMSVALRDGTELTDADRIAMEETVRNAVPDRTLRAVPPQE